MLYQKFYNPLYSNSGFNSSETDTEINNSLKSIREFLETMLEKLMADVPFGVL